MFSVIWVIVLIFVFIFIALAVSGCKKDINGGLYVPQQLILNNDGTNNWFEDQLSDPEYIDSNAAYSTTGSENSSTQPGSDTNEIPATSVEDQLLKDCPINIKDLPRIHPVIVENDANNNSYSFISTDSRGNINMASNDKACLSCPGMNNNITGSGTQHIQFTCKNGDLVDDSDNKLDISDIKCKQFPAHTTKLSEALSFNGTYLVDIGFEVESYFITLIQVCLSNTDNVTQWVKHDLVAGIGVKQSAPPGTSRPDFKIGEFYRHQILNKRYTIQNQKTIFENLRGPADSTNKLISITASKYFFAKGHLAPDKDFVFEFQQRATYYYINVGPQWQSFNNGNWSTLEKNIRNFADTRGANLTIYTGTLGVATYKNKAIYLNPDANQTPVPAAFWKLVYDPNTQEGTVVVCVNNPSLTKAEVEKDSHSWFGEVASEEITWLPWDKDNLEKGICYCCTVEQLRKQVPSLPMFTVKGLLK